MKLCSRFANDPLPALQPVAGSPVFLLFDGLGERYLLISLAITNSGSSSHSNAVNFSPIGVPRQGTIVDTFQYIYIDSRVNILVEVRENDYL